MKSRTLNLPAASESFRKLNSHLLCSSPVVVNKTPMVNHQITTKAVRQQAGDGMNKAWPCKFTIPGEPMGAPRQSRCDAWKPRPVVLRYRAFKDKARECAPAGMTQAPFGVRIQAYLPMPTSWPKKKKLAMEGKPHRAKPDWDNIAKGICDALWEQDCCIASGIVTKTWCWAGEERVEVEVVP